MMKNPDIKSLDFKLFLTVILLFLAVKMINLTCYPSEYLTDELVNIEGAAGRYMGVIPVFSFDIHGGARGNLDSIFLSLFTRFIKEKIEFYRFIPQLMNLIFLGLLYVFARQAAGKNAALFSVLIVSVSFWNFINSRMVTCVFILGLLMLLLYLLEKAAEKGFKYYALALLCYCAGMAVYVTWLMTFFIFIYYITTHYFEKRITGKKYVLVSGVFLLLSALAVIYLAGRSYYFSWGMGVLDFNNSGGYNPLYTLRELFVILFTGKENNLFFLNGTPFLSLPESVVFIFGLFVAIKKSGSSQMRKFAVLMLILIFPVLLSVSSHNYRIMLAMPAIYIIAGFGMSFIYTKTRAGAYAILVFLMVFSSINIINYFNVYEKEKNIDITNKKFALYADKYFNGSVDYLSSFDFEVPSKVSLRMKSTYEKKKKADYIAFKSIAYWEPFVIKYMYQTQGLKRDDFSAVMIKGSIEKQYPYLFVVLKNTGNASDAIIRAGSELERIKKEIFISKRGFDAAVYKQIKDPLLATYVFDYIVIRLFTQKKWERAIELFKDMKGRVWYTPDIYHKMAKIYSVTGDFDEAAVLEEEYLPYKKVITDYLSQ